MGTSDSNGNAYFLANVNPVDPIAVLLKYLEINYIKTLEIQIGHVTMGSSVTLANNIYASSTALLVTVLSNLYPQWSMDSTFDFVVLQLSMDGSTATSGFGFGSTAAVEDSNALVYIESESAAVFTYADGDVYCVYIAKVMMTTGGAAWSKKTCAISS